MVLVWRPSSTYVRAVTGDKGNYGRIRLWKEFDDWEQLYSLQLFGSDEIEQENASSEVGRETESGEPVNHNE